MSLFVVGNLLRKLGDKVRSFGTRVDKAHFAAQDIPKLWNLIYANLAYDAADAGGSIVALAGPYWSGLFSIGSHRTKFYEHEVAPVPADPFLPVKHRTKRIKFD